MIILSPALSLHLNESVCVWGGGGVAEGNLFLQHRNTFKKPNIITLGCLKVPSNGKGGGPKLVTVDPSIHIITIKSTLENVYFSLVMVFL